jgi:hypothetical protein
MQPLDTATNKSRAWFLISSSHPTHSNNNITAQQQQRQRRPVYDHNNKDNTKTYNTDPEGTIPAHLIPAVGQHSSSSLSCPFQTVKVEFCPARTRNLEEES